MDLGIRLWWWVDLRFGLLFGGDRSRFDGERVRGGVPFEILVLVSGSIQDGFLCRLREVIEGDVHTLGSLSGVACRREALSEGRFEFR